MAKETPESEVKRLHRELNEIRHSEIFGGLSLEVRSEYERKKKRLSALEFELAASSAAKKSSQAAQAEQQHQWSKSDPETDTPQSEGRQPYRSREKDSARTSASSKRRQPKGKLNEKSGE